MDVVVTVPKGLWIEWISEGDAVGDPPSGEEWVFWCGWRAPKIELGERVYIVSHNRLRGYAPLVSLIRDDDRRFVRGRIGLIRHGGAVAVTIPQRICGFQGWRYRWWDEKDERPFPDWKTTEVARVSKVITKH